MSRDPTHGPARRLWDLDEEEVREIFDEEQPEQEAGGN